MCHPRSPAGFVVDLGAGLVEVELTQEDTVAVSYRLKGAPALPASVVMDPAPGQQDPPAADLIEDAQGIRLLSASVEVTWDKVARELTIGRPGQPPLLRQVDLPTLRQGHLILLHAKGESMYGVGGFDAKEDASAGLLRSGHKVITAGEQGHAGAPFVWSTAGYGVLLDGVGGQVHVAAERIEARLFTAPLRYQVFLGEPKAIFGALAQVSGRSPLFPKWALGFTNSQWGIDQQELLDIVHTYRAKHIPIDNITLDFDWKAWGEDNGGEFRWNPFKFPAGPTGALKGVLDGQGMHLTGIMKPRIHVDTVEGREATSRGYWLAQSRPAPDYFSHKPVRELDFSQPAVRTWFFNATLKHSFATGIVGWWNDEADDVGVDTQHLDMQRALYEGQRAISNQRVWSLNRNFYLGAHRYAYGVWSGDIATGFESMAGQRQRMLSAINVGAMQWGMDGGGFKGASPTPENYARWIQFGAFTPIFRVHGDFNQKRQPWVYGPVAEKAATAAIRLRYQLLPYIYSYEHQRRVTGVGLVRPLLFDWPHDPNVRNTTDAWLFGDHLLVAPVVEQGQQVKSIYLPEGEWINWFSGERHQGGQRIGHQADPITWSDIPLYIRAGAIIPHQPVMDHVDQQPVTTLTVELFPAAAPTHFDHYEDDGATYEYERGAYFKQRLCMCASSGMVHLDIQAPEGSFQPAVVHYLLKLHGRPALEVLRQGQPLEEFEDLGALNEHAGEGWATGTDRFGPVTWVQVDAAVIRTLQFKLAS